MTAKHTQGEWKPISFEKWLEKRDKEKFKEIIFSHLYKRMFGVKSIKKATT